MECPKCCSEMAAVEFGTELTVQRCHACGGLFCARGVLPRLRREWLAETVLDTGDPRAGAGYDSAPEVVCPACGTRMCSHCDDQQPHIRLEHCPGCEGVFLDAGELTDLKSVTLMDSLMKLIGRLARS
jgi:Zn-finger nucleic acid-binding protein